MDERPSYRAQIEALIAEFAFRIDHSATDTVSELFTPDGWYGREDGTRAVGRDAIDAAYAKRLEGAVRTVRHVFTNLRLSNETETTASGVCILTLYGGDGRPPLPANPILIQDYVDEYQLFEGSWKFRSRTTRRLFVSDSFRPVLQLKSGQ